MLNRTFEIEYKAWYTQGIQIASENGLKRLFKDYEKQETTYKTLCFYGWTYEDKKVSTFEYRKPHYHLKVVVSPIDILDRELYKLTITLNSHVVLKYEYCFFKDETECFKFTEEYLVKNIENL